MNFDENSSVKCFKKCTTILLINVRRFMGTSSQSSCLKCLLFNQCFYRLRRFKTSFLNSIIFVRVFDFAGAKFWNLSDKFWEENTNKIKNWTVSTEFEWFFCQNLTVFQRSLNKNKKLKRTNLKKPLCVEIPHS